MPRIDRAFSSGFSLRVTVVPSKETALDAEARHYQDQLHQANQERMARFEDKLDRTLNVVVQIGEAIKCIPSMEQRLKDLEAERDQRKGAMAVIAFLCGAIGAGVTELVRHWLAK